MLEVSRNPGQYMLDCAKVEGELFLLDNFVWGLRGHGSQACHAFNFECWIHDVSAFCPMLFARTLQALLSLVVQRR